MVENHEFLNAGLTEWIHTNVVPCLLEEVSAAVGGDGSATSVLTNHNDLAFLLIKLLLQRLGSAAPTTASQKGGGVKRRWKTPDEPKRIKSP